MNKERSYKLPANMRVRREREFASVYAKGRKIRRGRLMIIIRDNDCQHPRLGISVPRRFGNAVRRNHIKRLIREAFRTAQHDLPAVDIICVPRQGLVAPMSGIRTMLIEAANDT